MDTNGADRSGRSEVVGKKQNGWPGQNCPGRPFNSNQFSLDFRGALGEVSQLVKRLVMISWVRVDVVAVALVKVAGGIVGNSVVMAMGMVAAIWRPV